MLRSLFTIWIIFSCSHVSSQTVPNVHWKKCYGGSSLEYHGSLLFGSGGNIIVKPTPTEGGYILCGTTSSNDADVNGNHGFSDFWIAKLDSLGTINWKKCYGGTNSEIVADILPTADSSYIVVGHSKSNDGDVTNNHGDYDCWVIKIAGDGTLKWQKSIGGGGEDRANSIIQTKDGNFVIGGVVNSNNGSLAGSGYHGGYDAWMAKINRTGSLIWSKCYGGTNIDILTAISEDRDSTLIMCGYTESYDFDMLRSPGNGSGFVLKTDKNGVKRWTRLIDGSSYQFIEDIYVDSNRGYSICGQGGYIGKLDTSGALTWHRSVGPDSLFSAVQIKSVDNSDIVVAGYGTKNGTLDYAVYRFDSIGSCKWGLTLGGSDEDRISSFSFTQDSSFILAGTSYSNDVDVTGNHGMSDIWLAKLNGGRNSPPIIPNGITQSRSTGGGEIRLYPNPSQGEIYFDSESLIENIQVRSMAGNLITEYYPNNKAYQLEIKADGLFMIKVKSGGVSTIRNVLVIQ